MKKLNYWLLLILFGLFGNQVSVCMELGSDSEEKEELEKFEAELEAAKKVALDAMARGEDPFASETFQTLLQLQRRQRREGEHETPSDILEDIHEYSQSLLPVTDEMKRWLSEKKVDLGKDVLQVDISPQSDFMVVQRSDLKADLYTVRNGQIQGEPFDLGQVAYVNISPQGDFVVAKRRFHNHSDLYTVRNGQIQGEQSDLGEILQVNISPQGDFVVVQRSNRKFLLYTVRNGQIQGKPFDLGEILQVNISPQSDFMVVITTRGKAKLYKLNQKGVVGNPSDLNDELVKAVEISPQGDFMVVRIHRNTPVMYKVKDGEIQGEPVHLPQLGQNVTGVNISPYGDFMVVTRDMDDAVIYKIEDGKIQGKLSNLGRDVSKVYISPRGDFVIVQRKDEGIYREDLLPKVKNEIVRYEVKNGKTQGDPIGLGSSARNVYMVPQGYFMVMSYGSTVVEYTRAVDKALRRTSQAGLKLIAMLYKARENLQEYKALMSTNQETFDALPKILQNRLLEKLD